MGGLSNIAGGGNHREKPCAIAFQLAVTDAGDTAEVRKIVRATAYHIDQRRIMENDIRWYGLFARQFEPQRAQRLPQRVIARSAIESGSGTPRAGPLRGFALGHVAAEGDPGFAAQHRRCGFAQLQAPVTFDVNGEVSLGDELSKN